jgi:hypothetical protein
MTDSNMAAEVLAIGERRRALCALKRLTTLRIVPGMRACGMTGQRLLVAKGIVADGADVRRLCRRDIVGALRHGSGTRASNNDGILVLEMLLLLLLMVMQIVLLLQLLRLGDLPLELTRALGHHARDVARAGWHNMAVLKLLRCLLGLIDIAVHGGHVEASRVVRWTGTLAGRGGNDGNRHSVEPRSDGLVQAWRLIGGRNIVGREALALTSDATRCDWLCGTELLGGPDRVGDEGRPRTDGLIEVVSSDGLLLLLLLWNWLQRRLRLWLWLQLRMGQLLLLRLRLGDNMSAGRTAKRLYLSMMGYMHDRLLKAASMRGLALKRRWLLHAGVGVVARVSSVVVGDHEGGIAHTRVGG